MPRLAEIAPTVVLPYAEYERRVGIREDRILLSGYGFGGISALLYGDLRVRPDPLSADLPVWEEFSRKRIPELSADAILTFADGPEAEERLRALLADPPWQRVRAVRSGRRA